MKIINIFLIFILTQLFLSNCTKQDYENTLKGEWLCESAYELYLWGFYFNFKRDSVTFFLPYSVPFSLETKAYKIRNQKIYIKGLNEIPTHSRITPLKISKLDSNVLKLKLPEASTENRKYKEITLRKVHQDTTIKLEKIQISTTGTGGPHFEVDLQVENNGNFFYKRNRDSDSKTIFNGPFPNYIFDELNNWFQKIDISKLQSKYCDDCFKRRKDSHDRLYSINFYYNSKIKSIFYSENFIPIELMYIHKLLWGFRHEAYKISSIIDTSMFYESRLILKETLLDSIKYMAQFDSLNYKPIKNPSEKFDVEDFVKDNFDLKIYYEEIPERRQGSFGLSFHFWVNDTGEIDKIYMLNKRSNKIKQELKRVLSLMPRFSPAYYNNEAVRVRISNVFITL